MYVSELIVDAAALGNLSMQDDGTYHELCNIRKPEAICILVLSISLQTGPF